MAVANRLSLNVAETEFMIIGCHQRLLVPNDEQINVQIDGKAIKRVSETKPWAYLDKTCRNISKNIASAIGAFKRVRQFIDTSTAQTIYGALIQPYFEYCRSVWDGLNVTLNDRLRNHKIGQRGSSPNHDMMLVPATFLVSLAAIIF